VTSAIILNVVVGAGRGARGVNSVGVARVMPWCCPESSRASLAGGARVGVASHSRDRADATPESSRRARAPHARCRRARPRAPRGATSTPLSSGYAKAASSVKISARARAPVRALELTGARRATNEATAQCGRSARQAGRPFASACCAALPASRRSAQRQHTLCAAQSSQLDASRLKAASVAVATTAVSSWHRLAQSSLSMKRSSSSTRNSVTSM
jgi:hypothetical protein